MAAGLQVRAVLTSILSLAVGLLALWVAKYRLLIEGDWLYVAMLVLPSVVYLVVSHQVGEVKVGDFAAQFANVSTQSVEVTVEALNLEEMTIDDKDGSHVPRERLDALGESTRIALALTMGRKAPNGRKGYYQRTICIDYMKELQYRHPFEFVVLLDQDRRLSGYMRYPQMLQLLENVEDGGSFVSCINEGDAKCLQYFSQVIKKMISVKTTNVRALRYMEDEHLEAVAVVDENGRFKGIVEREHILCKWFLGLAK